MTSRKQSVFNLRTVISIFICATFGTPAHALSISTTDANAWMAKKDNVIEATVVSSKIHTFNISGKVFSCGESFQLVVSDVLAGDAQKVVEVTQTLFDPEDMNFGNVERGRRAFTVGRKYLLGFENSKEHRKADYYPEHGAIESVWPAELKSSASKSCLSALPARKLASAFEVVQDEHSPYESESSNHEYVFLDWTRSASPELYEMAIGAEAKFSYIKTNQINPEARAYLEHFGRHTPEQYVRLMKEEAELFPELKEPDVNTMYFEELGRNGKYLFFDLVFPYDKFKKLLIDRIEEFANKPSKRD